MKSAWFEAAKKRAAAGGAPESPRRSACLLSLPLCKPLALTMVLKTALICTSEGPARVTSQSDENEYYILQHREQRTGAHVGVLLLACRHRPLADIIRPGRFWVFN
jgi:hypothetical protein